jgi:hypothetical protein
MMITKIAKKKTSATHARGAGASSGGTSDDESAECKTTPATGRFAHKPHECSDAHEPVDEAAEPTPWPPAIRTAPLPQALRVARFVHFWRLMRMAYKVCANGIWVQHVVVAMRADMASTPSYPRLW